MLIYDLGMERVDRAVDGELPHRGSLIDHRSGREVNGRQLHDQLIALRVFADGGALESAPVA